MVASSSGSISTAGSSTSPSAAAAKRSSNRSTPRGRSPRARATVTPARESACQRSRSSSKRCCVGDQELRARVGEAVLELGALPPRVERHHDGAGGGGAPERDRPLRVVAHRDRDPVALDHTVAIAQDVGERRRGAQMTREREVLAFVHEERLIAVRAAGGENVPQRARRVLPDLDLDTADRLADDLEVAARAGEPSGRFLAGELCRFDHCHSRSPSSIRRDSFGDPPRAGRAPSGPACRPTRP